MTVKKKPSIFDFSMCAHAHFPIQPNAFLKVSFTAIFEVTVNRHLLVSCDIGLVLYCPEVYRGDLVIWKGVI